MHWDVTEAKILQDNTLLVRFKDGVEGRVTFKPSFFRGVFASLNNQDFFEQVKVVDGVVTWPGELDLAPDAMHDAIRRQGEWVLH